MFCAESDVIGYSKNGDVGGVNVIPPGYTQFGDILTSSIYEFLVPIPFPSGTNDISVIPFLIVKALDILWRTIPLKYE